MSGNGRAGNGRGNSRRHSFRRRDRNNDNWQEADASGGEPHIPEAARFRNGARPAAGSGRSSSQGNVASERRAREPGFENQGRQNRGGVSKRNGENSRRERASFVERPKWVPPKLNTEPLPVPDCPWCGKPIRDLSQAIADKDTGAPVHFDCVAGRIAQGENLGKGDTITYIGGGRFGIVCFGDQTSNGSEVRGSSPAGRDFKIKKIIEWESKDKKTEWRSLICDHYSVT